MDQLFDPDKYNDYPEDSQWMVLKGCLICKV